jgi:uncharacterized protein YndB with AHSA1/START domain
MSDARNDARSEAEYEAEYEARNEADNAQHEARDDAGNQVSSDVLTMSFEVACSAQHAFTMWTSRISTWWPADHTVSGHPQEIVLEGRAGGRIYERTADGAEHDWGQVTRWEPPNRLIYEWHLGQDASHATEVEIQFIAADERTARVQIEHRGWERLGADAGLWRGRNQIGWDSLLPNYLASIAADPS